MVSVAAAGDIVLVNGRVWTANPAQPWCEAVAIAGDTIVAVGTNAEVKAKAGADARVIDLSGAMAMPGVIDSHTHFLEGSLGLTRAKLDDLPDLATIQRVVVEYARAHPGTGWVVGRGWLYSAVGGMPDRSMIDAVIADRPVLLESYDGHSTWLNTKGLEAAGITAKTPDPEGGEVVRDANGNPTGALKERASSLAWDALPPLTEAEELAALIAGIRQANSFGITSIVNAGGGQHELELYRTLAKRGELTVRSTVAFPAEPRMTDFDSVSKAAVEYNDDWVRAGLVKAFMDGVVESHTAVMLDPYADDASARAKPNYEKADIERIVNELDKRGIQVMTHAIGELGVRTVIDAYEAAARANGPRDRRYRIEHIETILEADMPRFGKLGIIAGMQPYHAYADLLGVWKQNAGPARFPRAFAWQSIASGGARLAYGSDWPVVSQNPWIGVQNAVTRQDWNGEPKDGWAPAQRVTLEQALRAYTIDGAYAIFQEKRRGSLEAGKLADLIVLDRDLFKTNPLEIRKTLVRMTLVGGRVVHEAAAAGK